mgnify:CR=1 FL=1
MILTIDIGNTNIVVGGIDKDKTHFIERISTVRTKTELEYAIDIKLLLDINKIKADLRFRLALFLRIIRLFLTRT